MARPLAGEVLQLHPRRARHASLHRKAAQKVSASVGRYHAKDLAPIVPIDAKYDNSGD
jgi:hypothetical protein